MKKNKSKYIICFFLVIIIFVSLYLIKYLKSPIEMEIKTSALIQEDTTNYKEELKEEINSFIKEEYKVCLNNEEYCKDNSIIIKTSTPQAFMLENYKYKYFFFSEEDKVKLYNRIENQTYSINHIKPDYSNEFVFDSNDNFIGVVYSTNNNNKVNYLVINEDKVIYKDKYDYIQSISPNYLSASKYDKDGNQLGAYILNAYKEKSPLITKEFLTNDYYGFYALGKKYITFEHGKNLEIYDNDSLKLIYKSKKLGLIDGNGNPLFLYGVDSKDNIFVYDDNYLSMLDSKGKEVKKSKKQINATYLVDKFIINTSNKKVTITDIDNNTFEIATLENGKLDSYEYIDKNGKEGIYFIIFDNKVAYKDVYEACKNNKCKGHSFEEFMKDYKSLIGYEYFYDYNTNKVTKTPTVIVPTNVTD